MTPPVSQTPTDLGKKDAASDPAKTQPDQGIKEAVAESVKTQGQDELLLAALDIITNYEAIRLNCGIGACYAISRKQFDSLALAVRQADAAPSLPTVPPTLEEKEP